MNKSEKTIQKSKIFARFVVLAGGIAIALGAVPSLSAATFVAGKDVQQVLAMREGLANTTSSTVFAALPGATLTLTLPANQRNLLIARFAAESACYGAVGWCSVRILANGVEMDPIVGSDFAFDSSDNNTETSSSWESHAMERSISFPASAVPIVVTVTVQRMVTNASLFFRLDDWQLTVEQVRQ